MQVLNIQKLKSEDKVLQPLVLDFLNYLVVILIEKNPRNTKTIGRKGKEVKACLSLLAHQASCTTFPLGGM